MFAASVKNTKSQQRYGFQKRYFEEKNAAFLTLKGGLPVAFF